MSKLWMTVGTVAIGAWLLIGSASPVQQDSLPAAPGVSVGARIGLSLDGHAGVFVVTETSVPWAKLELDLAFALDEAQLPVLPDLLASGASALAGLRLDEAQGMLDRLRGAGEDLEERARAKAAARVEESRANPLWVNFAALDGYVLVAAPPKPDEDR